MACSEPSGGSCCGLQKGLAAVGEQPFVKGTQPSPVGPLPRVGAQLTGRDRKGAFLARWGVGRMDYLVAPGLYALGSPDASSPVLVSANYKLSFDALRSSMPGRDAWVLVLDTDGINVWCAAGKGSFGTEELVRRIEDCGLAQVVEHRRLIVPQLGAPGVAAHEVRLRTGFRVRYGPVEARHLPAFLDMGGKASPAMRRKGFSLRERLVLVPVELVGAVKWGSLVAVAFFLLAGLGGDGSYLDNVLRHGSVAAAAVGLAVLGGAVITPLALPWLPGRAFSLKGAQVGLALAGGCLAVLAPLRDLAAWSSRLELAALLLFIPALAAFLAMNFTGASTYTSPSGVLQEMRRAVPLQILAALVAIGLWIGARISA